MRLYETLGVVANSANSWEELCDIIVRFIYDILDGMLSDPFFEESDDITVDKSHVMSYALYKFGKFNMPLWLNDFEIHLVKQYMSNGAFVKAKSYTIENNKMANAYIVIRDSVDRTPDLVEDTLSHEFRHAFDFYILLTKRAKSPKVNSLQYAGRDYILYKESTMGFKNLLSIIDSKGKDYILLDDTIYTDKDKLSATIRCSMYYTNSGELNSFLLEFAADIKRRIKNNKTKIIDLINAANKKKLDFNKLDNNEKWNSNILNSIDVTCYDSIYYLTYKAYQQFWNNIEKVDDELAAEVIEDIKKPVRLLLNKKPGCKLIHFDGDATNILKELKKQQTPIISNVCTRMERYFAHLIMSIEDEINNKI